MPLLNLGSWETPVAAYVRHEHEDYRGAIDVFCPTGTIWLDDVAMQTPLQLEFIVRGVAWCLEKKAKLPDGRWAEISKTLDAEKILVERRATFPPGPARMLMFPEVPPAPETLRWIDVETLSDAECTLLASAQGLINRRDDQGVLLIRRGDKAWLDELKSRKIVKQANQSTPDDLFELLGHRRAVIVDPEVPATLNLATMIASVEDLLVAYPGLVEIYNLEIAADLRGTFTNEAEVLAFSMQHMRPRLRSDILAATPPRPSSWSVRDYLVQHRVYSFWVDLPASSASASRAAPGNIRASMEAARQLLSSTPHLTPILGLSEGSLAGPSSDHTLRDLACQWGKTYIPVDSLSNLSLSSRLTHKAYRKAPGKKPPALDTSRVYVAVVNGDMNVGGMTRSGAGFLSTQLELPPGLPAQLRAQLLERLKGRTRGDGDKALPASTFLAPAYAKLCPVKSSEYLEASGKVVGGLLVDVAGDPKTFGAAFGPERRRALDELMATLGQEMKTTGLNNVMLNVEGGSYDDWTDSLASLPPNSAVFLGGRSGFGVSAGLLSSWETIHGVQVFRNVSLLGQSATLTSAELEPYKPLFPLFLTVDSRLMRSLGRRAGSTGSTGSTGSAESKELIEYVSADELRQLASQMAATRRLKSRQLVEAQSEWRYDDSGKDLGTRWQKNAFDDSAWSRGKGEFGYGDASEGRPEATVLSFGDDPRKKHITYYFRREFVLADKASWSLLLLQVMVDDGCVVYINGKEQFRFNMPEGEISSSTLASGAYAGIIESTYQPQIISTSACIEGKNTIAVEIHQGGASSSDLSFDLQLQVLRRERTEQKSD